mmetsp:Transcript_28414/g.86860  ORF Transcript_28414/g.86860 Transcript_28414/m.86860 type:complete len:87 (-) Transcript_28414:591-851(-)
MMTLFPPCDDRGGGDDASRLARANMPPQMLLPGQQTRSPAHKVTRMQNGSTNMKSQQITEVSRVQYPASNRSPQANLLKISPSEKE